MKEIKLMDVTLRDGGFINSWNFGHGTIVNLFERSVSAGIDYLEIGFLDEREPFDMDRSITPDMEGMNRIFGGLDKGNSKLFAMIDYGTCPLENIGYAADSVLDGIRVMVKKKTRIEALEFCRQLKERGFVVFVQPVSITGYSDEEMLDLVGRINDIKPFAMAMVDTYGLLDRSKLLHYFQLIDSHLDKDIVIGYHAHNNFQLAYSNSIALCEEPTERSLLIDGSAFGIGKSAGNCPLELLTMYANEHLGGHYHTSQVLEMIDTGIMKIYERNPWGYQMQYFLCASNDCHPKYPQYLLRKKTLSVKSVNEILSRIDPSERLAFNESHIEKLYLDYQHNEIEDADVIDSLRRQLKGRRVLVLGPGPSTKLKKTDIQAFAARYAPVVMAINYIPADFHLDYLFLSNSKRYMQLSTAIAERRREGDDGAFRIIATSNVTPARDSFDYQVDYSRLIDMKFEIPDNSLPMLLRLLGRLEVSEADLAGFDGYVAREGVNYADPSMEYEFVKDYAVRLNDYTKGVIASLADKLKVAFVTESKYE